ncbi:MAG: PilW family protein [Halioglobus sp.]
MMRRSLPRGQQGFTLIELMIGMLLGVMLMAGASSIYLATKQSYVEVEQVANLSENGRFASQLINTSLRHVGFTGRVKAGAIEADSDLTAIPLAQDCTGRAQAYDINNYLFAVSTVGTSILGCIDDAVAGTDVLVVKYVVPSPSYDGDPNDPNAPLDGIISFPDPGGLSGEETYVITNNLLGTIFDGADTAPTLLTGGDIPGGVAWPYRFEVFYIRQASANATPQLSRKTLRWSAGAMTIATEDLVAGVEDMRLQFGRDTTGNGEVDTYSAPAATELANGWAQVHSVEAYMLIRSTNRPDPQYLDTKTYNLGAANIIPPKNDNRRRLVVHSNISLRNPKLIIRGGA